jgi:hypothetical protein
VHLPWPTTPYGHTIQRGGRGNGYHGGRVMVTMGEGLCYLLQNSMEIWSMHIKWALQNVMSQSIVQDTFGHFF